MVICDMRVSIESDSTSCVLLGSFRLRDLDCGIRTLGVGLRKLKPDAFATSPIDLFLAVTVFAEGGQQ